MSGGGDDLPHRLSDKRCQPVFQDNLVNLVPKCQTVLEFSAAGDDKGSGDLQSSIQIMTTSVATLSSLRGLLYAPPVAQTTVSKH